MHPDPIYTPENTHPVHNLHFDWTGWFQGSPPPTSATDAAIDSCRENWLADGIKPSTHRTDNGRIQILADTTPRVTPVFLAQRLKGRLQHALRHNRAPVSFRRKVSVRSLGANTSETVENYIRRQSDRSDYVDPRFKRHLGRFSLADADVHLQAAFRGVHGQYWYNLHLVIVIADRRWPVTRNENFGKLRNACGAIARKKGCAISHLAVMPDHLHAAVRGPIDRSPEAIALAFLNNLSYVMGYNRCWSAEYYVGTFSEYTLRALRGGRRS